MHDTTAPVAADGRSLLIHGERRLLISGEIHYARVPEAEWERVLDRTKESGVNCVATYVFWNRHEPRPGVFDFSGNANLGRFLQLCRERDLMNIVRMGPYCCAEWNYGGFPSWLRDVPGITIRTWNEAYLACVRRYFPVLVSQFLPHLASRGGSVILVQVENEYNNVAKRYGAAGVKYLEWIVEYVKSLGIDVPTITCEGGAPGALEGINGFTVHATAIKHRAKHPDMPLLWTEDWPGWYDTWGYEHHVRDAHEIGYEILRFIAEGGSGFNYYMWHGGTNFGRTSMYLQTTSYGFDAPLGEWGEPTEKGKILSAFHHALLELKDLLLAGERKETRSADGATLAIGWHDATGSCLVTVNGRAESAAIVAPDGRKIAHPPHSAALWKTGASEALWKSWTEKRAAARPADRWKPVAREARWLSFPEPLPSARPDAIENRTPIEQLTLTHDTTDYCWYATDVEAGAARRAKLQIERGGDFFYVFVNGRLVDQTRGPLNEVRGPTLPATAVEIIPANPLEDGVIASGRNGYEHHLAVPLRAGRNRIEILACALGLIKGDWQLALSMQYERKGIWDAVALDGKKLTGWRHHAGLLGEKLSEPAAGALSPVQWKSQARPAPLTWHRREFSLTPRQLSSDLVWAFDGAGLDKGALWLNGHMVGRVWQIPAHGMGADPLPPMIGITGAGEPTQRYYRLPAEWLRPENRLLYLAETGAKPGAEALLCRPYRAKI